MGGIQYMGVIVVNEMSDEDRNELAEIYRAANRADYIRAEQPQEKNPQDTPAPQPTTPTLG